MATIAFFPEGAFGPTNNCVGIGDVLRRRGHDVVFIVEESFAGSLEAKGFEERPLRRAPPSEQPEAPGQFWSDWIRGTAPVFRKPTIEQIEKFVAPTFEALVEGARYADSRLEQILGDLEPDVVVVDNVVTFPAVLASRRPWVRIASSNPAEIKDPAVPPPFSGYGMADRHRWDEYWAEYRRVLGGLQARFDSFCRDHGAPPLPELEFIHESTWLNLYVYPTEIDYPRENALGERWHNLETSVRATDEAWQPPLGFDSDEGSLVYVSLGSLGTADTELMQRLIDALADSEHRVIVAMGPRHEELRLADNMVGEEFLPQTQILPLVDLVVTQGGNNTVTECFWAGKPMVVLPLFWDQYNNAQRVRETGYGVRLDPYGHSPDELRGTIDRLLRDNQLRARLEGASARLSKRAGTEYAADLIERIATN